MVIFKTEKANSFFFFFVFQHFFFFFFGIFIQIFRSEFYHMESMKYHFLSLYQKLYRHRLKENLVLFDIHVKQYVNVPGMLILYQNEHLLLSVLKISIKILRFIILLQIMHFFFFFLS